MTCIHAKAVKIVCSCLILICAGVLSAQSRPANSDLVAHEWGTFTSVAGSDGQAVQWIPLSLRDLSYDQNVGLGSSPDDKYWPKDLPSFVENLHWGVFKSGLPATIRMETPVLYFYAPHAMTLAVQVNFAKGLITEWYPHAASPERHGGLADAELYRKGDANGGISWNAVTLQPGALANLPRDLADSGNRYYAARETASTPVRVSTGPVDQQEKFLFYRGVSLSSVPLSATFTEGGKLFVKNSFAQAIPNIIWFQRRGDKVGYTTGSAVESGATTVLEPPVLTARLESLYGDLEEALVARGLYRDEAHAMIRTWRDSWFEEGSRLFYIVPASFVDTTLPLTISPAPARTVRVFVGRMELISPATQQAVAAALKSHDEVTLAKYGRFLGAIRVVIEQNKLAAEKQIVESPVATGRLASQPEAKMQP
jgi:hypothetical protein